MDEAVTNSFRETADRLEQEHGTPDRDAAITYLHILRGVLHYHERMTAVKTMNGTTQGCMCCDLYSSAVREAIRCLQQIHQIDSE